LESGAEDVGALHAIIIAPAGYACLKVIREKKLCHEIGRAIDGLARDPETQGKALVAPLEGLRSLRVARGRYRVIYKVDAGKKRVDVLLIRERKAGREEDIYALARRLLKTLLGQE
jgi:mRNA-degrading endonuclease RelE of RelBE toxin-antitoxin system